MDRYLTEASDTSLLEELFGEDVKLCTRKLSTYQRSNTSPPPSLFDSLAGEFSVLAGRWVRR